MWDKYKGKVAIVALGVLFGLPAVTGLSGLSVIEKADNMICVGFEPETPAPAE